MATVRQKTVLYRAVQMLDRLTMDGFKMRVIWPGGEGRYTIGGVEVVIESGKGLIGMGVGNAATFHVALRKSLQSLATELHASNRHNFVLHVQSMWSRVSSADPLSANERKKAESLWDKVSFLDQDLIRHTFIDDMTVKGGASRSARVVVSVGSEEGAGSGFAVALNRALSKVLWGFDGYPEDGYNENELVEAAGAAGIKWGRA